MVLNWEVIAPLDSYSNLNLTLHTFPAPLLSKTYLAHTSLLLTMALRFMVIYYQLFQSRNHLHYFQNLFSKDLAFPNAFSIPVQQRSLHIQRSHLNLTNQLLFYFLP